MQTNIRELRHQKANVILSSYQTCVSPGICGLHHLRLRKHYDLKLRPRQNPMIASPNYLLTHFLAISCNGRVATNVGNGQVSF